MPFRQKGSMANDGHSNEQDELVRRILREILGSDRLRESSAFSERSYADEPILRTGADLLRERSARRKVAPSDGNGKRPRPERRESHERAQSKRPRPGQPSRADLATYLAMVEQEEDRYDDLRDPWYEGLGGGYGRPQPRQPRRRDPLPAKLKELRALEKATDESGARLRGPELFVRQARLVADYDDDFDLPYGPQYRYYPSYRDLTDDELRGYFAWRARWRAHEAHQMPFTYVRLVAAELVNGVGAEQGEACLAELRRLLDDCRGQDALQTSPSLIEDLRTWIRDYVVYFGLDPKQAATEDERAFARSVATLRSAEREVLARKGLHGLSPADAPATPPTDAQVWEAFGAVSKYAVERSPFFRAHPDEAAAVGAAVFRRMAEHCAKRRKTLFVDGVVGEEQLWNYTPFLGLPFFEEAEHTDVTVRVTGCETISHRFGRWTIRRGFERKARDKDLGRLLKAIDRQMRIDWGFGRALKDQKLPKYLQRMVVEESAAEHERVEEAERRRITIDLSQLGHIRAAAATTREALLVDEERDEVEPAPTVTAAPAAPSVPDETPPKPGASDHQTNRPGAGGNPCDLSDLELEALRRLLEGGDIDDLLGPGKPMASVLVDSINEKLFDEVGDAVVEFDDGGEPRMVEDYEEDVRELVG